MSQCAKPAAGIKRRNMIESVFAVVMAGGGGTRLWPVSKRSRPKQSLSFGRPRTLFQQTVDRLEGLLPPERIFVVTIAEQAVELKNQVPQIPPDNYLIEPMPRGTASVVGLAAVALQQRDPRSVMVVLAADHFIENVPYFQSLLRSGVECARQGYLVTLGITPTFPSTGYGYVQLGEELDLHLAQPVFRVHKFKEKPRLEQAQEMLAKGDHAWNSGMFIWKSEQILAEMKRLMPDLSEKLGLISQAWNGPERAAVLQTLWPAIVPETIDFGVMEKADKVAVIPANDLGWNDVGSWESLFEVLPQDADGNIVIGAGHIGINTRETLVFSEVPGRIIATIGLENMVVVDTGSALLICSRENAQQVRQVVDRLKQSGRDHYL